MKIRVGSLLDLSTIDWSGHRTFMLFCSGCNFNCPFCDNASLIPFESGKLMDLKAVKHRILSNISFLDAIGFTGGEPSLQPKPIIMLSEWAKTIGLKIFLNTNGSNPKLIDEMLKKKIIDYIAMDVKAPLNGEVYKRVSGLRHNIKNIMANIEKTLTLCEKADLPVEVRTTIVPTLIDNEKSIREIARIVRGRYILQEFFPFEDMPDKELKKVRPPKRELLIKLAEIALETGVKEVYIRTRGNGLEKIMLVR